MLEEEIILVDELDQELGFLPKLEVHQKGLLHRAFSILVFNSNHELLIHQRAFDKYHSAGLWTNTCCSHPRKGESNEQAIHRRLKEEMGFDCELKFIFKFLYQTNFADGLIEHELDHVYIGHSDQIPQVDPKEVNAFRWINQVSLKQEMDQFPDRFTFWFKEIILNQQNQFYFPTDL